MITIERIKDGDERLQVRLKMMTEALYGSGQCYYPRAETVIGDEMVSGLPWKVRVFRFRKWLITLSYPCGLRRRYKVSRPLPLKFIEYEGPKEWYEMPLEELRKLGE